MTDYFYILPLVTIIILVALLFLIGKVLFFSRKSLSVIIDNLKYLALIILVAGFVIYFIGYLQYYDERLNFITLTFRSFLSSIGMFVLQSDLQYFVRDEVIEAPLFLSTFAVIHFLAALISAIFIINFVGIKLISWLKMHRAKGQNLYIFWGLNENTVTLAENIHKKKPESGMIIFIGTPQDAEIGNQQLSISALINGQSLRKDNIRRIEKIGAVISYCSEELKLPSKDVPLCNIFKDAGLNSISKIIFKSKDKNIRIFFLSDDQHHNLEYTSLLLKAIEQEDETLNGCSHLDIYCQARKNKENSVLEKQAYIKSEETLPNVHLIDIANLSIQILKREVDYQPISFVTPITDTATVEDPFTAVVIGFGETGRDAVRFLYEFGAFPNSQGKRSPFKCYAIDQEMDKLAGTFYNNAPAIKGKSEIELLQMNYLSEQFWEWVNDKISTLNYIVISCGDDEVGMQIAIDLLEKAFKTNMSMDHFKIFIRSYSKEKEGRMIEMANFYNQKAKNHLVVFGMYRDLYTYKNIIDEESVKLAREFYTSYVSKKESPQTWEQRHNISVDKGKGAYVTKNRQTVTLEDINGVIRKENQDIANYLHMETKLKLAGLSKKSTKADFDKLSAEQKKNIAICEHLRWNASHEMLGYVYGETTSDLHKTHSCLKPWQELTTEYQGYDDDVWNTTVDITLNSNETKNSDENK